PAAAAAPTAATKPVAAGDKPLSPLELARLQGAAKSGGGAAKPQATAVAAAVPAAEVAAPAKVVEKPVAQVKPPAPAASGQPMSILELARQQGAFKGGK